MLYIPPENIFSCQGSQTPCNGLNDRHDRHHGAFITSCTRAIVCRKENWYIKSLKQTFSDPSPSASPSPASSLLFVLSLPVSRGRVTVQLTERLTHHLQHLDTPCLCIPACQHLFCCPSDAFLSLTAYNQSLRHWLRLISDIWRTSLFGTSTNAAVIKGHPVNRLHPPLCLKLQRVHANMNNMNITASIRCVVLLLLWFDVLCLIKMFEFYTA